MNVSCDLLLNRSTAKLSKLCGEKIAKKELKKGSLPITGGEIHEKIDKLFDRPTIYIVR